MVNVSPFAPKSFRLFAKSEFRPNSRITSTHDKCVLDFSKCLAICIRNLSNRWQSHVCMCSRLIIVLRFISIIGLSTAFWQWKFHLHYVCTVARRPTSVVKYKSFPPFNVECQSPCEGEVCTTALLLYGECFLNDVLQLMKAFWVPCRQRKI